jgi:hypothetical protein
MALALFDSAIAGEFRCRARYPGGAKPPRGTAFAR